jgi:hypothetical protein
VRRRDLFSRVLGLLRALARRPTAAYLRSASAGQYRARRRLDPSPQTLAGTNQGHREVRDAEPDLRRPSPSPEGHLCAGAAWAGSAASELAPPVLSSSIPAAPSNGELFLEVP